MPKVSVIIPTFNSEKYIRETLESAIYQTLEDIEIIIADCESKDKTLEIIDEYAKNDSRIKVLHRPLEFVGISRNAALETATGDYIMFLDSDDTLTQDACEEAYNQISKNNDDMVYFAHNNFFEDSQKFQKFERNIKAFSNHYNRKSFYLHEIDKPFIASSEAWYKIYKKSFLDKYNIRFGAEKFGEDTSFYINCIINSNTVSVLNKYLYNYRKIDTSSCTTCGEKYWKDIFSSRPNCYKAILASQHKESYLKACLPFFINSIIYWYFRWSEIENFPKQAYYEEMHNFFKILQENHSEIIYQNKNYITHYRLFKHFAKENWEAFNFLKTMESVLSIQNEGKHKVFRVLGVKVKVKRKTEDDKKRKILAEKYKKLCKYYEKNIIRIKEKVKNGEKIRVAFYVNDSKWKTQALFELLQKNSIYEPFVLVGENDVTNNHCEYQTNEEIINIYESFKNKGFEVNYAYNLETNTHIPLENFNPDIVFYSRQFLLNDIYKISLIAKNYLTCYVPYFVPNSPINIEANYDFHNLLWKYFILNTDTQQAYSEIMANNGANLVPVGYPPLESYLNHNSKEKNLVIYAPHWSLGNTPLKYATFDWNGKEILDFAKAHPEIQWVFKPHPILKGRIIQNGLMTEEEVEEYWNEWDKIGIKYEGPDYLELFKQSKAMITDCGSFLAEYMPTKNPVILLRSKNATPYNFLAQKVTKYYYSVWDLEQLHEQLDKVILQGRDPWKERRLDMLESLNLVNNASQNIINEFNKEFGIESK